jgi:nitric oxide reductase large subunit
MYEFLQHKQLIIWILITVIAAIWFAIPEENSIKKYIKRKR